ncbi:MAG: hypothetical protein ACRECX_06720 [Methyloceanibacter sp.]|uniref:hypothetical protein n=1 Tax=Methyloceanibacter sp. TaxID=1965321 RepID=UPI003D6CE30B
MRILLILIIIAAIFAVVQSQRHGCKYGDPSWQAWFDCVIGKTASETPATTPSPPEPPAAGEPAPETPQ